MRTPWTVRSSNQSVLKETSPEYLLEGLLMKLKFYFGHLMQRVDSLGKTLMLGRTEGRRIKVVATDEIVGWHHQLNGPEIAQTLGDSEGQGNLHAVVHGVTRSRT